MFNPSNLQVLSSVNPKALEDAITAIRKDQNLKGLGAAFVKAEKDHKLNAVILASIACLESDYGNSPLALNKNNLFGLDARDSLVGTAAYGSAYKTKADSVDHAAYRIGKQYIEKDPSCTWRYLGKKDIHSVGAQWSSDKAWSKKVVDISNRIVKNIKNEECGNMAKHKLYVDLGHGGNDSGALNKARNVLEKNVVLNIGKKIVEELKGYDIEVKLSRTSDITKSLGARTSEANSWGADLLVSIHCNDATKKDANGNRVVDPSAQGLETYCYKMKYSKPAEKIHSELIKANLYNKDRKVKEGNLHMVRESNMAACLVETGFINNPKDVELLINKQSDFARAISKGVLSYYGIAYKGDNKPVAPPPTNNNANIKDGNYSGRKAKVIGVASNDVLNVRYDRDYKSKDIGDLKNGQVVTCEFNLNGWMSIQGFKGNKGLGYVNSKYLQLL